MRLMEKTKGGARPGSGRPKGSKNLVQFKKALKEYITEQELKNMVERAKRIAKKDPKMLQFILEQVFGKAKATVESTETKTTNIAIFLDQLENGRKTSGQIMEIKPSLLDQGQGPEYDTVQA